MDGCGEALRKRDQRSAIGMLLRFSMILVGLVCRYIALQQGASSAFGQVLAEFGLVLIVLGVGYSLLTYHARATKFRMIFHRRLRRPDPKTDEGTETQSAS